MEFFLGKRGLRKGGFEVLPFLEWMRVEVERSEFVERARGALARAEELCPSLVDAFRAPQAQVDHMEGSSVRDHILRAFSALEAVVGGASLQIIEEYDSHPQVAIDLDLITHTLQEHYATFAVFLLLHDSAVRDTLRVREVRNPSAATAPFEHALRAKSVLGASHEQLYGKLVRAQEAVLGDVRKEEIMAAVFVAHGLVFEATDHEKWFVNDASAKCYEPLFLAYRLSPRDIQHVKFLIRYHVLVTEVTHHRGVATLSLLEQSALSYGIDGGDARDLLLCVLFLNDICGKIVYRDLGFVAQTNLLLEFVRAEELGFLEHRKRKQALRERRARGRMRWALAEAGLTLDGLMADCHIPYTAERDDFARRIYAYLQGVEGLMPIDVLGEHAARFQEQLLLAKERFDETA